MLGGRCAFPLRLKPGSTRPAYRRPRRDAARVIGAGRRRRRFAATRNGIKGYFCGPVFPCAALFCWASLGVSWSVDPVSETKGDRAIVRRIGRLGSHFALQRAASDPTPAENSTGVGGGGHTSPNRPRTSRSHAPAWGRLLNAPRRFGPCRGGQWHSVALGGAPLLRLRAAKNTTQLPPQSVFGRTWRNRVSAFPPISVDAPATFSVPTKTRPALRSPEQAASMTLFTSAIICAIDPTA